MASAELLSIFFFSFSEDCIGISGNFPDKLIEIFLQISLVTVPTLLLDKALLSGNPAAFCLRTQSDISLWISSAIILASSSEISSNFVIGISSGKFLRISSEIPSRTALVFFGNSFRNAFGFAWAIVFYVVWNLLRKFLR